MHCSDWYRKLALVLVFALAPLAGHARPAPGPPSRHGQPLLVLGPGDEVRMHVFGQPSMNGTMYVGDDGTLSVPLAGPVHVGGMSPSQAAQAVEAALKHGQFLVNPHVTFTIVQSRSQQASVLGQVRQPGIYSIEANTTLLDLLAKAGGETKEGADTVYILRATAGGTMRRLAVDLLGLAQPGAAPKAAEITMRAGDQVYVPRAPVVFVTGQVHKPGQFRLDPGMTVLEAISRAGGVTQMGSTRRVIIKRREPNGRYREISPKLTDEVEPNDVVTVEERIF